MFLNTFYIVRDPTVGNLYYTSTTPASDPPKLDKIINIFLINLNINYIMVFNTCEYLKYHQHQCCHN